MRKNRLAMSSVLSVVGVLAIGLLGGCQGVDQRLPALTYRPTGSAAAASGQPVYVAMPVEAHGLARNKDGEVIIADAVTKGGSKRAGVVSVEPIAPWVANALANELRVAGLNAAVGNEVRGGRPVIRTEIVELKNDTKSQWSSIAATSTIRLAFAVERDGVDLGKLEVEGSGTSERAGEFKDVVHEGMQAALRDALMKAVPRLKEMVGR